MNLFNYHEKPHELDHHDDQDLIPIIVWEKYKHNNAELKKREKMWARDPKTAYYYGAKCDSFKLGEPAIAKEPNYSYLYAYYVIKGRFELGEPAIAKDAQLSYWYAANVLKGPFPLGEPVITKDAQYSHIYQKFLRTKNGS